MARRPSDVAAAEALLADARAHLRVGEPAAMASAVARSHIADGRCVGWFGSAPVGWAVAIDAEIASAVVPSSLAARFGTDGFWERWTLAESLCKLADVPMVSWWRDHGLRVPDGFTGRWRTLALDDLVVSVAVARANRSAFAPR